MTQQFIRTLQQLRHEILVLPFRERIANYINVLTAPTNLGKTFSIFNELFMKLSYSTHYIQIICIFLNLFSEKC